MTLKIADDIFDFINDVVQLSEELEEEYFNQITQQEVSILHLTAFERISMRRGREEGEHIATLNLVSVSRQLKKPFPYLRATDEEC